MLTYTTVSYNQDDEPTATEKSQEEKGNDEYWSDCNIEISDFQHNQLLHIVSHYSLDHMSKQTCRTSSLSGEAYIQELLHTAYPR